MLPETMRCLLVEKNSDAQGNNAQTDVTFSNKITNLPLSQLPEGEVVIQVEFSSLNYKDALVASGHPGIVKQFPHIPGIDAAGAVAESSSPDFQEGQKVLVTGYGLGAERWGGYCQYIRVPASYVVAVPEGLSPREAMIYGTAGFTAGRSVWNIVEHGIVPEMGEIAVSGATGGVGSLAVAILAKLGYQVVAVSRKAAARKEDVHSMLKQLGASRIVSPAEMIDQSDRPLLKTAWAAAVDCTGGEILSTFIRSVQSGGMVTTCGMVAGAQLPLTVFPFILRGVYLAGIDSACTKMPLRKKIWQHLATDWRIDNLEEISTEIGLDDLPAAFQKILAGENRGRVVVKI